MHSLERVIRNLGGAATRQQLIASGHTGYAITAAVRGGRIIRCRQARYVLADTPSDVAAAVRVGGLLAGPSAAGSYGLWAGFDTRLHVSVGSNSSRLRTNYSPSFLPTHARLEPDTANRHLVIHWLRGGAVPEIGAECWRVPALTCLKQVVAWSDRETAIACLDTALTVLRMPRELLIGSFEREPTSSRLIAAQCRHGSDSGVESIVRQRLLALGIDVEQQVHIAGVGRVDLRILGSRVLVEVDGHAHHGDAGAFEKDRRRDAELAARGYVVVRLSYRRVFADWGWCERMLLAAIATNPA